VSLITGTPIWNPEMAIPDYQSIMLPLLKLTGDGQQLAELMIEHNLGVTRKEVYEVKQIDSDYFSEEN